MEDCTSDKHDTEKQHHSELFLSKPFSSFPGKLPIVEIRLGSTLVKDTAVKDLAQLLQKNDYGFVEIKNSDGHVITSK
jgi:hypothetical protein